MTSTRFWRKTFIDFRDDEQFEDLSGNEAYEIALVLFCTRQSFTTKVALFGASFASVHNFKKSF